MEQANKILIDELKSKDQKFIVDFYGNWCGPCTQLAPQLERIESETPNVTFLKVDIDQHKDLLTEYEIISVPTVLFFKGKTLVNKISGLRPAPYYKKLIETL